MTSSYGLRHRFVAVTAAGVAAVVGLAACSGSPGGRTVRLVAYSVPKPAYDALAKAFAQTPDGRDVHIKGSYGPSGSQSKAVLAGQQADYVAFSLEPDLTKLVPAKVAEGWNAGPTKGLVSDSVVVIVVRKGNPLGIAGWDDLVTKPGVEIVTPSPKSSGAAKWNILAAYSHVLAQGGSEADARAYLTKFYARIKSRADSGAKATAQFRAGTGNVLISYENEAITARANGADFDYLVPDQSFLIENPAAVTTSAPEVAKRFLEFVESEKGQQVFAGKGFRPVLSGVPIPSVPGANDPADPFPQVKQLTTIADLGGWPAVNETFFGDDGIVTKIENSG